jgi:hypothetical protein
MRGHGIPFLHQRVGMELTRILGAGINEIKKCCQVAMPAKFVARAK